MDPNIYNIELTYLDLDLDKLKEGVINLVAHFDEYFDLVLDVAYWSVINKDGIESGKETIDHSELLIDKCNIETHVFWLNFYHKEVTPNFGLEKEHTRYFKFGINFKKHRFLMEASIIGGEHLEPLAAILTSGLHLINIMLPPEHQYLEHYIKRFYTDNPIIESNIFLIMRFEDQQPLQKIVNSIRETCNNLNLNVLMANEKEYTDDLWDNVMTYMYGCGSAVAVFDQVNYRQFNPNVALEVGFMLAQRKQTLLLKGQAIIAMPSDMVGKIYKPFDTYNPEGTIPPHIERWITDYAIGSK